MADARPIGTVGDLIERLREFDPSTPVRAQHGLSGTPDFVLGVGWSPDQPEVVAVVYMPPPREG